MKAKKDMQVRDRIDDLRERRALKLMRACDLTREQERRLARECGLSVAELRRRSAHDRIVS